MKFSCQETLAPGANFAEKLRNLEKFGFDAIELHGGHLHDATSVAERKAALRESPVRASSICGGFPSEVVHPDRQKRQACLDTIRRFLDLAAEFGAAGVITAPIFNHSPRVPDMSPWKTSAEAERELLLAVLAELVPHAEAAGTALLLEPLNRYESDSLPQQKDGAEVVRRLNSRGVRLMSDTFHMNLEELKIPASIRACGDTIGHLHLADATRREPGSAGIDFQAIFAALREIGFQGYMAYECGLTGPAHEVLPRSLAYLRERV